MTDYKHYLRVSPTGRMDIKTFDPATDVNDVIHDELDGAFYDIVRCRSLPRKYLMLVDDCGAIKGMPVNRVASELYGIRKHGCPIFGTALIMREALIDNEPDIVGLTNSDCDELIDCMKKLIVIRNGWTGEEM